MHGRYLREGDWWSYTPPVDCSWTWKKICATKDKFKAGCYTPGRWDFQGRTSYTPGAGYRWLQGGRRVSWFRLVWARSNVPRHAFITWLFLQGRLHTKHRLGRFIQNMELSCSLCHSGVEDETHLFSSCPYATQTWNLVQSWWSLPTHTQAAHLAHKLSRSTPPKARRQIDCAVFAAVIYHIWFARNQMVFEGRFIPPERLAHQIKDQVRQRILFLNITSTRFAKYIDELLN